MTPPEAHTRQTPDCVFPSTPLATLLAAIWHLLSLWKQPASKHETALRTGTRNPHRFAGPCLLLFQACSCFGNVFCSPFARPLHPSPPPPSRRTLLGTRLRWGLLWPRRDPAKGLPPPPGDHVLQQQDTPPEWQMLYETLDLLTCSWVAAGQEHSRLPLVRGRQAPAQRGACPARRLRAGTAVLQNSPLEHRRGRGPLGKRVGASWPVPLAQRGPAEAVRNNIPAPPCGWHCQPALGQDYRSIYAADCNALIRPSKSNWIEITV